MYIYTEVLVQFASLITWVFGAGTVDFKPLVDASETATMEESVSFPPELHTYDL